MFSQRSPLKAGTSILLVVDPQVNDHTNVFVKEHWRDVVINITVLETYSFRESVDFTLQTLNF